MVTSLSQKHDVGPATAIPVSARSRADASSTRRNVGAGLSGGLAVVAAALTYTLVGRLGLPPLAVFAAVVAVLAVLVLAAGVLGRGRVRVPGDLSRAVLVAPAAFYVSFFLAPLVVLVMFAFAVRTGFATITFGVSTDNFSEALSGIYIDAFLRSLRFAALGTVLTVAVGFPFAYWLTRHAAPQRRTLFVALIMVPFWTSFLIRAYAMVVILSDDFALARALRGLHVIDDGLGLLYHSGGVQIGLVYGYLPMFILPLYATMERLDWSLVQAAQDLGANKWRAFTSVTVPLAAPGVLVGALLVFIPMIGEYIVPGVLGGGQVDLIGNIIARAFLEQQNYPFGAALGSLVMLALTAVMALYIVSSLRSERKLDA